MIIIRGATTDRIYIKENGTFYPATDSLSDLGTNGLRWANVYADTYYGDGSNLTGISTADSSKLPLTGGTLTGTLFSQAVIPTADNTYELGSSTKRWQNVYTGDLHLSNKGKSNKVDNSWGDYTIQEGAEDLFLINNRNGKMYKFMLQEVS